MEGSGCNCAGAHKSIHISMVMKSLTGFEEGIPHGKFARGVRWIKIVYVALVMTVRYR